MDRASIGARARRAAVTPGLVAFLASASVRRRPQPLFRLLRRVDPVHRSPLGVTVLSRHADVAAVLRDPSFSSDEGNADVEQLRLGIRLGSLLARGEQVSGDGSFNALGRHLLLFLDPPDHTRIRSLVAKAFTPRRVEALEAKVGQLVDELVAPLLDRRSTELMGDLAYPLPALVVCELLGIPDDGVELFVRHAPALATRLDPQPMRSGPAAARADVATAELRGYLDDLVEQRRRAPQDDLLSGLAAVEADGDRLGHEELLATVLLLVLAGHETTANVIGAVVHRLVGDRRLHEELAGLSADGMKPAVDELLRVDGPVQMSQRITLAPTEVGGCPLPAGHLLVLLLAAANRDPAAFDRPDEVRLDRSPNPHVAFGAGAHYCIGAALARLELRLALSALAQRLPRTLELAGPAVPRPSFTVRGFERLPLRW